MSTDHTTTTETSPSSSALLTFLVVDIRGYTSFSAEHGDFAASRLSERFQTLCREVIGAHDGAVFGSAGDQALAAFPSAHGALRGALALQLRLTQEYETHPDLPIRAGIGLDTGEGVRVGSDFRGNAINLAARLCSIAAAGEIFASETVLAVARVVEGISAIDRGEVALKGLAHPVRVIQLAPDGLLPAELPPLQPILVTKVTNLPDAATPFIGRDGEIDAIARLLHDRHTRLVTLTGPGGTGKTRLALQVGANLLHDYQDGVFFVSLAVLTDPALVSSAIASILGLKEEAGTALIETVTRFLEEKYLLLVLDNFEHLLDASSAVSALLDDCRNLHIVVTSRIPLHLSREQEYPVPSLAVPDPQRLPSLEALSQYDAVALFIDRAQAVKPDFVITAANAPAVAEICFRLDGLPLAIELAAARTKLFPPQALLPRLSHRLTLLTGGARDLPARQQTLRNTIAWSYALLAPAEQILFAHLSVFAGGCSFEAAEAVCNPTGELDSIEGMASLVDKNLLRQEGDEEPRFVMLETLREYAAELLAERGERDDVQRRHAEFFTEFVETAEPELVGAEQARWLARLERQHENLRAALTWGLEARNALALRLGAALWRFWEMRGHFTEGRRRLDAVLTAAEAQPHDAVIQARALNGAGNLAWNQGDYQRATTLYEESLQLRREIGDTHAIALTLGNLGIVAAQQGEYQRARDLYEESLRLERELGNKGGIALALNNLGDLAERQGEYQRATESLNESLQLRRELGDTYGIALTLTNLGGVASAQGNYQRAKELYEETLQLGRALGNKGTIALALSTLGEVAWRQGEYLHAAELLNESLQLGRELGDRWGIALALSNLGEVARRQGEYHQATELFNESLRLDRELGDKRGVAFALVGLGAIAGSQQEHQRAIQLLGAADAVWMSIGSPPNVSDRERMENVSQEARAALSAEIYEAAWQTGQAMTVEQAVAYALKENLAQ